MSKSNRDPEKEKFWREVVASQQKSGLTQPEYCRVNGLNENSLSWWKREIPARDKGARKERAQERAQKRKLAMEQNISETNRTPSFVPLVFAAAENSSTPEGVGLVELRFPGAAVLIHAGADNNAIRSVILAFRECWF